VLQFFLNLLHLGARGGGPAARLFLEWLLAAGLIQTGLVQAGGPPHWDGIQLFDTKAARILEMVQADWEDAQTRP
jgi:hypothetical protein